MAGADPAPAFARGDDRSHDYAGAHDGIEYSRLDHSFLVSAAGSHYLEPDSHTLVIVACDGTCIPFSCLAECRVITADGSLQQQIEVEWWQHLPGSTAGIVIDAADQHPLVGNNLGLVYCFRFDGSQTGRVALPAGVTRILRLGVHFRVGLDDRPIWCRPMGPDNCAWRAPRAVGALGPGPCRSATRCLCPQPKACRLKLQTVQI